MTRKTLLVAYAASLVLSILACNSDEDGANRDIKPITTPDKNLPPVPFTGPIALGNPCNEDNVAERCPAGTVCDPSDPGGYCRPQGACDPGACEAAGGACASIASGLPSKCWAVCGQGARSPRATYRCKTIDEKPLLIDENAYSKTISVEEMMAPLAPNCEGKDLGNGNYEFEYTIDDDTVGYQLVTYSLNSNISLSSTTLPDGQDANYAKEYIYHNAGAVTPPDESTGVGHFGTFKHTWGVLVPLAPRFSSYLQPGVHTHRVALQKTDAGSPCIYVVQRKPSAGKTMNLNFYFATKKSGLNSINGPTDGNLQNVLDLINARYAQVGITLGKVRYFDLPAEVVEEYQIIRTEPAAKELMAYGRPLDRSGKENLSIDVFLVDDILLTTAGQVIGLSGGIPGQVGLHGMYGNGLLFKSDGFGVDNDYMANLISHELGHYLGLRHTTETFYGTPQGEQLDEIIGSSDPIDDTPVCETFMQNYTKCPDFKNMMFPVVPSLRQTELQQISPEQSQVLLANPFIR